MTSKKIYNYNPYEAKRDEGPVLGTAFSLLFTILTDLLFFLPLWPKTNFFPPIDTTFLESTIFNWRLRFMEALGVARMSANLRSNACLNALRCAGAGRLFILFKVNIFVVVKMRWDCNDGARGNKKNTPFCFAVWSQAPQGHKGVER